MVNELELLGQIKSVMDKNLPLMTNLSNASAIINQLEDLNWCGFYLSDNDRLILGPFQGEVACTIIKKGKGVCGTAFELKKTLIVSDVTKFKGHIACSSKSRSEIVVPIIKNDEVKAVIDLDSPTLNRFTEKDKELLIKVAELLKELF